MVNGGEPSGKRICNLAFAEVLFGAAGTVDGPDADDGSVGGGRPARSLLEDVCYEPLSNRGKQGDTNALSFAAFSARAFLSASICAFTRALASASICLSLQADLTSCQI